MKITQTNYRNQRFHKTPNCLYKYYKQYTLNKDINYHNIKLLRAWR